MKAELVYGNDRVTANLLDHLYISGVKCPLLMKDKGGDIKYGYNVLGRDKDSYVRQYKIVFSCDRAVNDDGLRVKVCVVNKGNHLLSKLYMVGDENLMYKDIFNKLNALGKEVSKLTDVVTDSWSFER